MENNIMRKKRVTKFIIRIVLILVFFGFQQEIHAQAGSGIIYEFRSDIDYPLINSNNEMLDYAVKNDYRRIMVKVILVREFHFLSPKKPVKQLAT